MKVILTIILANIGLQMTYSIKCWECQSNVDLACKDPFDNSTLPLTDCGQVLGGRGKPISTCRKVSAKVNEDWIYFRSCGYRNDLRVDSDALYDAELKSGNYHIEMDIVVCDDKDGCNSG